MKTKLILLFLLIIPFTALHAQEDEAPEGRREKVESMKIGFITQQLNLTSEEAKVFWPVYNQYQQELSKLRKTKHLDRQHARKKFETLSDKEIEKLADGELVYRQAELDLLKKYHVQFKQILPIKKVALLYKSEQDFKRELLKKMKEGRGR